MSATRLAKAAIKIPMRIERGPTDILRALASTVKYHPKEPGPVLSDDPFLLPRRPVDTSNFILSKTSGRKAARFIMNKNPELFYRDQAEPKVEAFHPPEKYEDNMEFSEDDIIWCIENKDPENALVAYNKISEQGIKLSDETLLKLFEMICYSNEDKLVDELEYTIAHYVNSYDQPLVSYVWKQSGLAQKIFQQIKADIEPTRTYSAMISGLIKYNEHMTAKQLFDEFNSGYQGSHLLVSAYGALISSIPRLYSSVDTAYEAINEIVRHMESGLVMPDLRVFNSILSTYQVFNCDEKTCQLAFQLMNDMKKLNVEPSLATYSSLISIVCRFRGGRPYGAIIPDILDALGNSEILSKVKDDRDLEFFPSTMSAIANNLRSPKLAHKLHKLYLKNPAFFKNFGRRGVYLNNYFRLIINVSNLEDILVFYRTYLPVHFRPSPDVFDALAEALDMFQADDETVKSIGRDIVEFGLADKVKNDSIFRRFPDYEQLIEAKQERRLNK